MDRCQHLAAAAGTALALSPVSIGLPASRAEPRDRAGWLVSCSPGSPAAQRGRVCSMPAPTMLRQRLARRAPCRRPTVGGRVPWCLLQPSAATVKNTDLWTAWIAGGLPCAVWERMLKETGFLDVAVGPPVDTFRGRRAKRTPDASRSTDMFSARKPS